MERGPALLLNIEQQPCASVPPLLILEIQNFLMEIISKLQNSCKYSTKNFVLLNDLRISC